MTKYRNPKHLEETKALEEIEKQEELYSEPAKTVEEEIWKKRAGDKDRYITKLKEDSKRERDELERKLDQAVRGQLKAPKSDEDVELWMKEYPEFAGILETIVQKRIKESTTKTDKKFEELTRKERELELRDALNELKRLHPDFDKLSKSEEFHEWLSKRPESDRTTMYNGTDVNEADKVITKYKVEKGKLSNSKVEDETNPRDTAKVVRTPGKTSEPVEDFGDYEFSESQIDRESKRNKNWWAANEDKIMSAARRNKILYDVSGGAR